jgi:tetratricopeptide (TPR) repeat protein
LQRGLDLSEEIGDEAGKAYILANLGLVALDAERPAEAARILNDGFMLAHTQHDQWLMAIMLHYLSLSSMHTGDYHQAISYIDAALKLRRELDLRPNEADDLVVLAVAHLYLNVSDAAIQYARQSLAILDECQGEGPEFPQRDYFLCAQVFAAAGETETARRALDAAYRLVLARADKITDPDLRRSFLERVTINRQIVAEMQKYTAPPPEEEQGCTMD